MIYIALIFGIVVAASLSTIARAFIFLGSQKPRIEYMAKATIYPEGHRVFTGSGEYKKEDLFFEIAIDERDQRQASVPESVLVFDQMRNVAKLMMEMGAVESKRVERHDIPPWVKHTKYWVSVLIKKP
jgi:hypothetical protein